MRVNNTGSSPIQGADVRSTKGTGRAGADKRADRSEGAGAANTADGVKSDISTRGRELARAKEIAAETPDVREDKIADIKARLADGKYKVSADDIADKMVSEHLHMGIG
jgi:negative regulator of flagellin synthesis FlgM